MYHLIQITLIAVQGHTWPQSSGEFLGLIHQLCWLLRRVTITALLQAEKHGIVRLDSINKKNNQIRHYNQNFGKNLKTGN